jgi:hypothetical protein
MKIKKVVGLRPLRSALAFYGRIVHGSCVTWLPAAPEPEANFGGKGIHQGACISVSNFFNPL